MHPRTHPLEQAAPLLNMGRHTTAARQMPHPATRKESPMSLRNETLYDALQTIASKVSRVETDRQSLERSLEQLEQAKQAAQEVIKQLSTEEIRELAAMPIKAGDVLLHLQFDEPAGEILITEQAEPRHRALYELLPEETPAEKSARLQRIRQAAERRGAANQEGAAHG